MTTLSNEFITSAIAFAIFGIYHIYLAVTVRRTPMKTALGTTHAMRQIWAKTIFENQKDIAAIQTLRNHIMAASFLASTAILISLGVLGMTTNPDLFTGAKGAIQLLSGQSDVYILVKFIILALDLFIAFFNFTLTIRYFNHASYVISFTDKHNPTFNHEFLALVMDRGSLHYFIGMRGLYLTIPLFLWVFGGMWFLAGVIVLILAIYILDQKA